MGNLVSCASSRVPSSTVKVMDINGRVEEFQKGIKAEEVMLKNGHHFLCHSSALQMGRRVAPLSADEDLEPGDLYFLIPIHKFHSVVLESDMASLAFKANSALKRTSRKSSKILPVFGDLRPIPPQPIDNFYGEFNEKSTAEELAVPRTKLEDLVGQSAALARHRMSRCRSWKPKLETISETCLLKCCTLN